MKFGKTLPRLVIPEWSGYYINYKSLKKHISSVLGTGKKGDAADLIRTLFVVSALMLKRSFMNWSVISRPWMISIPNVRKKHRAGSD